MTPVRAEETTAAFPAHSGGGKIDFSRGVPVTPMAVRDARPGNNSLPADSKSYSVTSREPRLKTFGIVLLLVVTTIGCASAQRSKSETVAAGLRIDEVAVLSRTGMSDDELIAQIEQRGVAFVLSPQDFEKQRAAGISDGVLRYLQGRSSGEQGLKAQIAGGRYRVPAYSGPLYLGYPYLGYHGGLHHYGGHQYGGHGGAHGDGRHGGHQ